MKSIRSICGTALAGAALLFVAGCATGDAPTRAEAAAPAFTLDAAASSLTFVTTKNVNVAEVQQFKRFTGTIAPSGAVTLVIDLASVETNIPIRNERMQTMLFEVAQFPTARFDAVVDPAGVRALKVGESMDTDVAGKLSIHGHTEDAKAALRVVRLAGNRVLVTTRAPVLVSASQFGLTGGVENLREIVALPNISGTVPVSFALVFAP